MNSENEPKSGEAPNGHPKIHQPEYVILDAVEEDQEKQEKFSSQGEYLEVFNKLSHRKFSWGIRLLSFIVAVFASLVLIFIFLLALVSTALGILTLYLNKEVNETILRCWRNVRKLAVILMGLLIGVFSPSLGFGLIILYLMMHGESLRKTFFYNRMFRS